MSIFKNKPVYLYFFFFFLILVVYWDTRDAGFVTDFLDWQTKFDTFSFGQIIHPTQDGIKSFYHLTHLQMYALTAAFGTSGLPWFLVFVSLFALNGLFVFLFFQKLFTAFDLKNGSEISFMGVLCFLLSPYQAEVMVWRAAFHYFTAFAMMMGYLLLTIKYLQKPNTKIVIDATILYAFSVFALEFFYFTPFLAAILLIFWQLNTSAQMPKWKKIYTFFVGIPLSILGIYFLIYHFSYNKWIAHYGADAHKNLFSPEAFSTYGKYVVKHLFYIRYQENYIKVPIFQFFDAPNVAWTVLGIVIGTGVLGIIFFKKMNVISRFTYLNFIVFSILIAPAISLFFVTGLLSENDRFGYFASPFLFMGATLLMARLPKLIFRSSMAVFLGFSLFFLVKTTNYWFLSERIQTNLTKTYNFWDYDEVLSLNTPDNFAGIPMFKVWDDESGIPKTLLAFQRRKIKGKIYDVQRYNMVNSTDGVHVKVNTPDSLTVLFNQFGTWWWKEPTYETPQYRITEGVGGYTLKLKPTNLKRIVIFQAGNTWHEVDLSKIGVEQR